MGGRYNTGILSANDPQHYARFGIPLVADLHPGAGPLGGIEASLDYLAKCCESVDGVISGSSSQTANPLLSPFYVHRLLLGLFLNEIGGGVERFGAVGSNQVAAFNPQATPRCVEHGNINRKNHVLFHDGRTARPKDRGLDSITPTLCTPE